MPLFATLSSSCGKLDSAGEKHCSFYSSGVAIKKNILPVKVGTQLSIREYQFIETKEQLTHNTVIKRTSNGITAEDGRGCHPKNISDVLY